jgi:gluconate 2-dehydrogenase gamma chain
VSGLAFFTPVEARAIAAVADRIFPADGGSPSATELGAVEFIDAQLAGPWGQGDRLYRQGPFFPSPDGGHGWQSPLSPAEAYRHGLLTLDLLAHFRHGAVFAELVPDVQDALLSLCERGETNADFGENLGADEFFVLLRTNVVEALFADPRHGGNRDGRGWRWLGFPESRARYAEPEVIPPETT